MDERMRGYGWEIEDEDEIEIDDERVRGWGWEDKDEKGWRGKYGEVWRV